MLDCNFYVNCFKAVHLILKLIICFINCSDYEDDSEISHCVYYYRQFAVLSCIVRLVITID